MDLIFSENRVNYILRMYLPRWNYGRIIEDIIRFCGETGTEHVMFFTDAQHMTWNQLTIEEAKAEAANLARAAEDLGSHGIKIGLNTSYNMPMSRFDHRRHNPHYKHWVTYADGTCPHTVPCLLDPALKDYLTEYYGILASVGAEYLYIDDDHRYVHSGAANTYGCMCGLHLSEFSRITGREWTREELHRAVYHDVAVRRKWLLFLRKGLEDIAKVIENAVHRVAPEMRVGMMVPCLHSLAAYDYELPVMARLFQPAGKLLLRPCIGPYQDYDRTQIVPGLFYMELISRIMGGAAEYTPEIETTPFTRVSKSMETIRFCISQGIVNRMPNPAVSACGYVGNSPYFEPEIAKMLKRQKPFFEALLKIAPERGTKKGIGMEFSPHSVLKSPLVHPRFPDLAWPSFTLHDFLSSNGFCVTYDDSPVLFLAGDTVYALPDEKIRTYFKMKHLILDAEAAKGLAARGYQDFLGCRVEDSCGVFGAEYFSNPDFCGIYAGTYSPLKDTPIEDVQKIVDPAPETAILSVITDHDRQTVCPAVTLYQHQFGKKVAVMNYRLPAVNPVRRHLICYQKQVQFLNLIRAMDPMAVPVFVDDPTCFAVQYFDNGKQAFAGLANLSYDIAEELTITFADPGLDFANGKYLREDGELRPLPEISKELAPGKWKIAKTLSIFHFFALQIPKKNKDKRTMKTSIISLLLAAVLPLSAAVLKNDDFSKGLRGWNTPGYWPGKTKQVEENGKKYLQLESGVRDKTEIFGRALGYGRQVPYFPGDTVVIKIKAKGSGTLSSGVLVYRFGSGAPQYAPGGEYPLTSEFKTYEFRSGLKEQFRMILPYMEIKGAGKAVVESFRMETAADPSISVETETPLQIASEKNPGKPVVFKTSVKNGEIAVSCKSGEKSSSKMETTSADGSLAVPTDNLAPGFHQISASKAGHSATSSIDVQPENVFRTTDETAGKIKLDNPVSVLFLGDSLSDFYRGYNYIDRIAFWVGKYNPGKFTIRNAGVGGDFCKRMLDRLQGEIAGKRMAYRQEMYNGLFKEKYDLIFLFLGQNDTRCFRKDGFAKQETPPELQQKCLAEIRKIFQEKCPGAQLVLISPSPSDEDLFIQRDRKLPEGASMVMYGKKEFVDLYDAENRKFCRENGLPYIDILSVMRAVSPIRSLYVVDGIHLSPEGGRVIADEILKFLAGKYQ